MISRKDLEYMSENYIKGKSVVVSDLNHQNYYFGYFQKVNLKKNYVDIATESEYTTYRYFGDNNNIIIYPIGSSEYNRYCLHHNKIRFVVEKIKNDGVKWEMYEKIYDILNNFNNKEDK